MNRRRLWIVCIACGMLAAGAWSPTAGRVHASELAEWVKQRLPDLVTLYRELHTHPELSFHEEQTARRVAQHLSKAGVEVTPNVGGHGLVGVLRNGSGRTVMVRTDLDGLPVVEQTGLVYSSTAKMVDDGGNEVGVMHACGHDIHMTNLVGVARYLAEHKDAWKGTVVFVGQPAEERGAGAEAMLKDGLFTRFPKPDVAIALHVDASLAAGKIGCREGYALANVDSVDIIVRGKGGHGAHPHSTVDPIVQAAELIMSLQTIVSREIDPVQPSVITVGSIHGGTKHNIIGNECHLQITVRSYTDEVRKQLLDAIQRKAQAIAQGARAPQPEIKISEGTPAMYNDPKVLERLLPVFRRELGEENVVPTEPSMGGEDFSEYGRAGVPILMYRLGSVESSRLERFAQLGQQPPSLHSPIYYPDAEQTLTTGLRSMIPAVLELLKTQD